MWWNSCYILYIFINCCYCYFSYSVCVYVCICMCVKVSDVPGCVCVNLHVQRDRYRRLRRRKLLYTFLSIYLFTFLPYHTIPYPTILNCVKYNKINVVILGRRRIFRILIQRSLPGVSPVGPLGFLRWTWVVHQWLAILRQTMRFAVLSYGSART